MLLDVSRVRIVYTNSILVLLIPGNQQLVVRFLHTRSFLLVNGCYLCFCLALATRQPAACRALFAHTKLVLVNGRYLCFCFAPVTQQPAACRALFAHTKVVLVNERYLFCSRHPATVRLFVDSKLVDSSLALKGRKPAW